MSQKDRAKTENLQVLLEQHWLHCRHLESERAWFMSVYAAITGGMFAFMAYSSSSLDNAGSQSWWPLYFLIVLTFFGFFHSIRWTYAFECHRVRVNKLARILWIESDGKSMLDPTMDIPPMRILPEFLRDNEIIQFLHINKIARYLNEVFRTRYLFAFFYFFMLIGLVILSMLITDFPIWGRATSIAASVVVFCLFLRWHSSLEEVEKTKKVVLEGCNGEWAQQCYLPFLVVEADERNTELWALDFGPQIKLTSPGVTALWQSSCGKGKSCYLDKSSSRTTLDKPDEVSYVFVVTPDRCHAEVAAFWLERLAPEGKIFIEKPLDASVEAAEKLKDKESIFVFDHYLARAYPFLLESARYSKQIGDLTNIEFHLLEDYDELKRRAETLDKGAIFDLFCHALVIVCAAVSQNTTCPTTVLSTVKLGKPKAAQLSDRLISGETFAQIKFMVNLNIEVVSNVGYCGGNKKDKSAKLYGTKGRIELDFVRDEFTVFDARDRLLKKEKLLSTHVKTYLERLLPGKKQPLSLPGVLSFDAALGILKILDKAKQQIGKMPLYQYNDSIDKILEILGEGKLQ